MKYQAIHSFGTTEMEVEVRKSLGFDVVHICSRRRTAIERACIITSLLVALITTSTYACWAEQPVWATGHIADSSGRAISGAIIAVYDDNNRVLDYARTDESGDYALSLPHHALHLQEHHGKGFIADVYGGVTRFAGGTAEFVANPIRAGVRAVTSSEVSAFADPLTKGGLAAGSFILDRALFAVAPRPKHPADIELRKMPGAFLIKVIAPDRNDLVGVTRVYWLEKETFKAHGRQTETLAAWLDPIQLTPTSSDRPSSIQSTYLNFTGARMEPSLAEVGQVVRLSATLQAPPDPVIRTIVIARDTRTGKTWELQSVGKGRYEAEIEVDKHFARDDHPFVILAYPASEQKPGRRRDVEQHLDAAGMWDTKRPYVYDPLIVVSRNRAELTLTVLGTSRHKRD